MLEVELVSYGDLSITVDRWRDAGALLRRCLEVPLSRVPRDCQVFFGQAVTPHGNYDNTLTRSVLEWEPRDDLKGYWSRL